jgi:hypothetical protein
MLGGGRGGVGASLNIVDNVLLMAGLSFLALGLTYSMVPYGPSRPRLGKPIRRGIDSARPRLLDRFRDLPAQVALPLFDLSLFRNRPFAAATPRCYCSP